MGSQKGLRPGSPSPWGLCFDPGLRLPPPPPGSCPWESGKEQAGGKTGCVELASPTSPHIPGPREGSNKTAESSVRLCGCERAGRASCCGRGAGWKRKDKDTALTASPGGRLPGRRATVSSWCLQRAGWPPPGARALGSPLDPKNRGRDSSPKRGEGRPCRPGCDRLRNRKSPVYLAAIKRSNTVVELNIQQRGEGGPGGRSALAGFWA